MTRFDDWQGRLAEYLRACEAERFEWGRMDCGLFAAGAVEAMTGEDPAHDLRGRYRTAHGAQRAFRKIGFKGLEACLDGRLPRLPGPLRARRGDLAMIAAPVGEAVGVIDLTGARIAAMTDDGLEFVSIMAATAAWSV